MNEIFTESRPFRSCLVDGYFFFFPSLSVFVLFIFDDTNENEKNKVQVVGGNYALVGKLFD